MEIGIVGLPNVGKSSLFNALTGAGVAAENFPFTTIEPNVGVVPLPDARLNRLAQEFNSQKMTPAGVRFVDIAGIVKGASQGEGLGNMFLAHIRGVDAIAHVVRCFTDDNVINVLGDLNPAHAIGVIETELILADLQQAEKACERLRKAAKSGEKEAKEKVDILEGVIKGLNEGKSVRSQKVSLDNFKEFQFLTAKPLLYVANTNENGAPEEIMRSLQEIAQKEKAGLISLCTKLESEILELPPEERAVYYEQSGITSPGLGRLAKAGQELLGLISFFTAGEKESRAWIIPQGTKSLKAAGKIHSDIERGFIRAEVYKYADLERLGSYKEVQKENKITLEGKEYEIEDGDVVYFRFSV